MDTTLEYIKQCEKAEEIQAQFNPDEHTCLWDGVLKWDWDRNDKKYDGFVEYGGKKQQQFSTYDGYLWHCIWLPTQDQLQAMIHYDIYNISNSLYTILNKFHDFALNPPYDRRLSIAVTMEQLWLAFVMKECHNKVWSTEKEEWVSSQREDK